MQSPTASRGKDAAEGRVVDEALQKTQALLSQVEVLARTLNGLVGYAKPDERLRCPSPYLIEAVGDDRIECDDEGVSFWLDAWDEIAKLNIA